jgi:uncharacterized protein YecE (DUF72 family)
LPPGLPFAAGVAGRFYLALWRLARHVVCEPRHPSWFTLAAADVLARDSVPQAAAVPAVVPEAAEPGGWSGLMYYRLHGSPQVYYSAYLAEYLSTLAEQLTQCASSAPVWCIFDDTAFGAATANALDLLRRITAR